MLLFFFFYFQDKNNPYIDFFFRKLKTYEEKEAFLKNHNDPLLINLLKGLLDLYTRKPFFDAEIKDTYYRFIDNDNDHESLQKLLTEWQELFYVYTLEERNNGIQSPHFKGLLEANNPSFNYILELDKTELSRLTYLELAIKAMKKPIGNKQEWQEEKARLNFERIVEMVFPIQGEAEEK